MLMMVMSATAMSYEQARDRALFLTDKMAYELNLNDEQYEAAYEVNLDYLMSINTYDDLYGTFWTRRNLDLSYILFDWQYNAFCSAAYFYRPLTWTNGVWRFSIYARYPTRTFFYFGRPAFYATYCGGHSWRMNGGRSWYHGRTFGPRQGESRFGMRDRYDRGDFRGSRNHGGSFDRRDNSDKRYDKNDRYGRGNGRKDKDNNGYRGGSNKNDNGYRGSGNKNDNNGYRGTGNKNGTGYSGSTATSSSNDMYKRGQMSSFGGRNSSSNAGRTMTSGTVMKREDTSSQRKFESGRASEGFSSRVSSTRATAVEPVKSYNGSSSSTSSSRSTSSSSFSRPSSSSSFSRPSTSSSTVNRSSVTSTPRATSTFSGSSVQRSSSSSGGGFSSGSSRASGGGHFGGRR